MLNGMSKKAERPKLWIAEHHHKGGFDLHAFYQAEEPTEAQVIDLIEGRGGSYSPEPGVEWIEVGWHRLSFRLPHAPHADAYCRAAIEKWHCDGEIEIDSDTTDVSAGNNGGAYVQAWVWVSNEEAGLPDRHRELMSLMSSFDEQDG